MDLLPGDRVSEQTGSKIVKKLFLFVTVVQYAARTLKVIDLLKIVHQAAQFISGCNPTASVL